MDGCLRDFAVMAMVLLCAGTMMGVLWRSTESNEFDLSLLDSANKLSD